LIIIFDLDDTLYKREDFVNNGLSNVSKLICSKNKNLNKNKIFRSLKKIYYDPKIINTFNFFLKRQNIKNVNLRNCLTSYRYGVNKIKLYSEVLNVLKYFKKKSYLLTDGNKDVQKLKIKNLNIKKFFKKIYLTNNYGIKHQKPSLFCFEKIKKKEKCNYNQMVYIGDNPNKDFINCNKVGIQTIRIMKGEFKKIKKRYPYEAKYKIKNLNEVKKILSLFS
jgi:putative hydrolase of the HAD superfamily